MDGTEMEGEPHLPSLAKVPIRFGLETAKAGEPSLLEAERERQMIRAKRFGIEYKDPARVDPQLRYEAKKERLMKREPAFALGFDIFDTQEVTKRKERADRFQLTDTSANPIDNYRPDEEIVLKAKRAEKYSIEYAPDSAVMMDMDLFEERHEPEKEVARRTNAIYLYGVDVMSTMDVLGYWKDHGPTFVEWINDSSCNILFADEFSAKRAMVYRGHPLPPTADNLSASGLDPTDIENLPYLWHQGSDFVKAGADIKLIYRMATADDVKNFGGERRTRELWKTGEEGHKMQRRGDHRKNPNDGNREPSRGSRRRKTRDKNGEILYKNDEDVEMENAEGAAEGDMVQEAAPIVFDLGQT